MKATAYLITGKLDLKLPTRNSEEPKKLAWPANVSPLFIPAGCPELNSAENIWQYLRQTYLSNRVFATYTDILDAASGAWNKLLAETGRVASIATRGWAVAGQ